MDCGARCGSLPVFEALPVAVKSRARGGRIGVLGSVKIGFGSVARGSRYPIGVSVDFQGKNWHREGRNSGNQKSAAFFVKATSAESNKCEFRYVGSPLEPQSAAGRFLSSILKNQPHIFHVAATKQLEELVLDRSSAVARQEHSLGSSEACLHGRIAEMKELECQFAVEEVMYMLVVHSFSKIKVPMVPRLSKLVTGRSIEIWPSKDRELESIHHPEVLELIKHHLCNILGREERLESSAKWSAAQIRKLQLGRLYAASIMYGYFLKSAWLRHHLELNLARTDEEYPLGCTICVPHLDRHLCNLEEDLVVIGRPFDPVSFLSPGLSKSRKPKNLKSYVMEFDPSVVQLCAKLRSQEAANLIENHSLAIFGDSDTKVLGGDEMVSLTFSGLKRLVLEAVAFGTFLWDAEGYVDSIYGLKENQLGV